MHVRKLCAALFTSALAGIGLVTFAAPSYASGYCGNGTTFTGAAQGQVQYYDPSDWYTATTSGTFAIALQPAEADADLYVYDGGCNLVCTSGFGSVISDACSGTANGALYIEVRLYSGDFVDYALTGSGTATVPSGPCVTEVGQTVCASLTTTSVYNSFTVNTPGSTPASVAGYVNSYEFTLPNGGRLTLPCVVLTLNSTTADECTAAGGRYLGTVYSFSQSAGLPTASLVTPLTTVRVCNANLVATVDGFGVSSFPVYTVC